MESLHGILVFLRVVELGTLSGAARQLGVTTSAVSSALTRLERRLDVRLLNRTTRRMSITVEGAEFYARCKEIVAALEQTEHAVARAGRMPSGTLRVSLPAALGRKWVIPHLGQFARAYPAVHLEIFCSDYVPHTIDDGLDVAVQIGDLHNSSLTARRLAAIRYVIAAAPSYLAKHGTPSSPDELLNHSLLTYRRPRNGRLREWRFYSGGSLQQLSVDGIMSFNSGEALATAAKAGLGIVQLAEYYVESGLKRAELVELLPEYSFEGHVVYAVFGQHQSVPPKARVFVDFLVSLFSRTPWTRPTRSAAVPLTEPLDA